MSEQRLKTYLNSKANSIGFVKISNDKIIEFCVNNNFGKSFDNSQNISPDLFTYFKDKPINHNLIKHGDNIISMSSEMSNNLAIGRIFFSNGSIFEGLIQEKNMRSGKFKMNNNIYKGDFKNNLLNGRGIIEYSNGDVYEGEITNNMKNGKGVLSTNNNKPIHGTWINDIFQENLKSSVSDNNSKKKYLKYKLKYIQLKKNITKK